MKPAHLAASVLALAVTGLGVLAWQQQRELIQLRGAALVPDERADLQKRIWDLEKTNRDLTDQLLAGRTVGDEHDEDSVPSTEASPDAPPPAVLGTRNAGGRLQQQLAFREAMANPEIQAAIQLQRRLGIEERYAPLFRNLNLSPDQAEKLKSLLAERQSTMQDIALVAREQGINPRSDPEAFRKLVTDAQSQFDESVRAALGDSGLTQLQTFERTLPQRAVVNDLQQRLNYSDTPLTPAQSEQLVQILANNTPTRPTRGNDAAALGLRSDFNALAGGMSPIRGSSIPITADAVNQAQGVLSQPQVNALQQMRAQQQAQQQVQRIIRDTMRQSRGGNTAAPVPGRSSPRGGG